MRATCFVDATSADASAPVDERIAAAMVCCYEGEAIPMTPEQFARLRDQSAGRMVIGRRAVLRAIEAQDGDYAHQ